MASPQLTFDIDSKQMVLKEFLCVSHPENGEKCVTANIFIIST